MKKLLIVPILVCLFTSCDDHYSTEHTFYVRNLGSDTLELRYQTTDMETFIDTIVAPYVDKSFGIQGSLYESGKEDRLTNEAILDHFKFLEFVKGTDTFRLDNTTLSKWLIHYDRLVDSGFKRHSYRIEVTDADLE